MNLKCARQKVARKLTSANRTTIKKHLATLVNNKQLAKHSTGKGTWYDLNIDKPA
jgi:predicted HTH transcriptional regulator